MEAPSTPPAGRCSEHEHRLGRWWIVDSEPPVAVQMADQLYVWRMEPRDCVARERWSLPWLASQVPIVRDPPMWDRPGSETADWLTAPGEEHIDVDYDGFVMRTASGEVVIEHHLGETELSNPSLRASLNHLEDGRVAFFWTVGTDHEGCCYVDYTGWSTVRLLLSADGSQIDPSTAIDGYDDWVADEAFEHMLLGPVEAGPGHGCHVAPAGVEVDERERGETIDIRYELDSGVLHHRSSWQAETRLRMDWDTVCGQQTSPESGSWSWTLRREDAEPATLISFDGPYTPIPRIWHYEREDDP